MVSDLLIEFQGPELGNEGRPALGRLRIVICNKGPTGHASPATERRDFTSSRELKACRPCSPTLAP
jgi:hypothetical protein